MMALLSLENGGRLDGCPHSPSLLMELHMCTLQHLTLYLLPLYMECSSPSIDVGLPDDNCQEKESRNVNMPVLSVGLQKHHMFYYLSSIIYI